MSCLTTDFHSFKIKSQQIMVQSIYNHIHQMSINIEKIVHNIQHYFILYYNNKLINIDIDSYKYYDIKISNEIIQNTLHFCQNNIKKYNHQNINDSNITKFIDYYSKANQWLNYNKIIWFSDVYFPKIFKEIVKHSQIFTTIMFIEYNIKDSRRKAIMYHFISSILNVMGNALTSYNININGIQTNTEYSLPNQCLSNNKSAFKNCLTNFGDKVGVSYDVKHNDINPRGTFTKWTQECIAFCIQAFNIQTEIHLSRKYSINNNSNNMDTDPSLMNLANNNNNNKNYKLALKMSDNVNNWFDSVKNNKRIGSILNDNNISDYKMVPKKRIRLMNTPFFCFVCNNYIHSSRDKHERECFL